jgi:hypothetical protein
VPPRDGLRSGVLGTVHGSHVLSRGSYDLESPFIHHHQYQHQHQHHAPHQHQHQFYAHQHAPYVACGSRLSAPVVPQISSPKNTNTMSCSNPWMRPRKRSSHDRHAVVTAIDLRYSTRGAGSRDHRIQAGEE